MAEFLTRLERACARAEQEFPRLAAPGGTVAVQFVDLRALLTLAQGIEARSDETATQARPVGQEPGPDRDAPK